MGETKVIKDVYFALISIHDSLKTKTNTAEKHPPMNKDQLIFFPCVPDEEMPQVYTVYIN